MQPAERTRDLRVAVGAAAGRPGDPDLSPPPLEEAPSPPPTRAWRFLKAYWVTFVVLGSYLSVRVQARYRSPKAIERLLVKKHLKNARRIHRAILSLQGMFIKVGQLISIMTNFLPPEFRSQLESLQDHVPPRPYGDIERRIREEFGGRGPMELFAEFATRPIAAASMGQVHVARLHTGEKVAVKVQYPDIDAIARIDLKTLRRILSIVSWFLSTEGMEPIYDEIRAMILEELDFLAEAGNVKRIAANFEGRKDVAFPTVVDELTTGRVLTTRWEDGVKVGDGDRLQQGGFDRKALARLVVESYCQQIFVDGVYHADPHPGNLLVRRNAETGEACLVYLDFGAVAQISPKMRHGMLEFLQGAIHRDTQRIVRAMKEMGFHARGADPRVFDRVIEYFHGRFQEEIQIDSFNLRSIRFDAKKNVQAITDLRRMDISLRELTENFHVPKDWILLERTVLLLTGLCTALDPEMSPMAVIRPYLERFVLGEDTDWSKFVVDTTKDLAVSALALPSEIRRFVTSAERGELEVTFRNVDDAARLVYTLGHQVIYAAVGIAAGAAALVYEGRGAWGQARTAWYVAGGAGVFILGSMWGARHRLKRRKRR